MLFLFNLIYAATWGIVAFLIPTEIFPSEMRAQGNGFGITGWAIGVEWTVLVNPIMFAHLESRTYFTLCRIEPAMDAHRLLLLPRNGPSIIGVYRGDVLDQQSFLYQG